LNQYCVDPLNEKLDGQAPDAAAPWKIVFEPDAGHVTGHDGPLSAVVSDCAVVSLPVEFDVDSPADVDDADVLKSVFGFVLRVPVPPHAVTTDAPARSAYAVKYSPEASRPDIVTSDARNL